MSSALSVKGNYSTRTDLRLTVNNIAQYQLKKGYSLMAFYHLQAEIDPSHHVSTLVGAPE
jgi:hypothetical protein